MVEYGMPAETPPPSIHNTDTGHPRAVLFCRPNSHPFTDRNLLLDQEVKVGRSIARAKPGPNNAIFDCKVLSRNHAVLWYSQGKFYLQDTKSSNGTFVNNQRLSKGTEESSPREVCSGDIVQFGVDVMENSRQVTHGCIIATLKLYLPDGKEAKASQSIVNTTAGACIPPQDLYQLNTFIQESIAREQLLENKLIALQTIISDTELSSKSGWKALMEEDRLLTRVEILENQLGTYSKSMSEDKLREEAKRLMEDKEKYQIAAKDNLKNLVDEKLDTVRKLQDTETKFSSLQQEYNSIHSLYNGVLQENSKLSVKISDLTDELGKVMSKDEGNLEPADNSELEENSKEIIIENIHTFDQNGDTPLVNGKGGSDEENHIEDNDEDSLNVTERLAASSSSEEEQEVVGGKQTNKEKESEKEEKINNVDVKDLNPDDLRSRLKELESELLDTRDILTESRSDNSVMLQEMNNLKNKLDNAERLIESQDCLVKEMEIRVKESSNADTSTTNRLQGENKLEKDDLSLSSSRDDDLSLSLSKEDDISISDDNLTLREDDISTTSSSVYNSDYSDATLKRSPSKNKCPSCKKGRQDWAQSPAGDADNIIDSAAAAINELTVVDPGVTAETAARVAELERQNFELKQQLMELEERLVVKTTDDLDQLLDAAIETGPIDDLVDGNEENLPNQSVDKTDLGNNDHDNNDTEQLTKDVDSKGDHKLAQNTLDTHEELSDDSTSNNAAAKTDPKHTEDKHPLENKIDIIKEIPKEEANAKKADEASSKYLDDSATGDVDVTGGVESPGDGGESLLNLSCSSCSEFSQVEIALSEAEIKIAQLLKLRENLIKVQAENHDLEQSVADFEEDIQTLSATSRVLTLFNIVPVLVLFIAVFIAFLPSLSNLMGTRDL